jgi:NADPH-dependent curcumin reductase CurA
LIKSPTIRGFIQTEFAAELMGKFLERATPWARDGSLQHREDIVDCLETRRGRSSAYWTARTSASSSSG